MGACVIRAQRLRCRLTKHKTLSLFSILYNVGCTSPTYSFLTNQRRKCNCNTGCGDTSWPPSNLTYTLTLTVSIIVNPIVIYIGHEVWRHSKQLGKVANVSQLEKRQTNECRY